MCLDQWRSLSSTGPGDTGVRGRSEPPWLRDRGLSAMLVAARGRVGLEGPFLSSVLEVCMHRYSVNKRKSAGKFKSHIGKTKALNLRGAPMRGGIRL